MTVDHCCGSMFDALQEHRCADETAIPTKSLATEPGEPSSSARPRRSSGSRGPTTPTTRQASPSVLKEPAMQIGKEQQEFEILPTEEEQQPVAPSQPEPQPEDAPA